MLSENLKQALRDEYQEHGQCKHTDVTHCHALLLAGAVWRADEDLETEEDYEQASAFIMDETLSSLILRGFIEPAGIDEQGDFTYQATPQGVQAVEERHDDDAAGC